MSLQSPRLLDGVLGRRVAGEELDSLKRMASLPLNPMRERKCLRELIRSHAVTCGQGLGSRRTFPLDGAFIHSKACINGIHCSIIVIVHNIQIFIQTGGGI